MALSHFLTQTLSTLEARGRIRRPLVWCVQTGIFLLCAIAAFLLRFDFTIPPRELPHLMLAIPVWIVVKSALYRWEKLDSGWWGFISIFDVAHLAIVNVAASVLGAIPILLLNGASFPRSIYALDLLLCFLATAGVRVLFRILMESSPSLAQGSSAKRTIIYGAGHAGVMLLRETRAGAKDMYQVCGFVDDDPRKSHGSIQGLPVWGSGAQLAKLVQKHQIQKILIAVPSATGAQMTEILKNCSQARVPYKTIPSLTEVLEGKTVASVRNVAVEDLLGRSPVHLNQEQIGAKLRGRIVLVTGAGGSIGSELCRQLARFSPQAIVAYDNAENALFHLDLEMRERFPDVSFCPEIGSIQNPRRLAEVLAKHPVSLLYHAAAYKHVPLLEAHVVEGVENNVLGTACVVRLAVQYGVEDVVMISTDKAVHPASVLGATKRAAELVVNSFDCPSTKCVSVRFGNVLGSNGSVIPLFKKQIAAGGPVSVTHPDMLRYFMTIPEAAQLVLQASALGRGGEIFVLDMGEPMKILDLARNLIILSGLRPGDDIKIVYSGLRPGEKLYEELSSFEEDTVPTSHQKIKIFRGPGIPRERIAEHLQALTDSAAKRDVSRLILQLKDLVPDYNPSVHLLRRAIEASTAASSLAALASVVGPSPGAPEMGAFAARRARSEAF